MKSKLLKISVAFFLCFSFAGCNLIKNTGLNKSNSSASKKDLTIVTSFYPIYISTINITKGINNVRVINMTKQQTGCLHNYSITPNDIKTLESSKIFIINGAGMESFMNKVISQQPQLKIIEASKGIPLLKDKKTGEANPHVWVSISNAILQVNNITKQLSKYDPANKAQYNKNATKYVASLKAEKEKMRKAIDKLKNRNIITFHEAFIYFAKEFNLNVVDVIQREPGSEPNPKELKNTIETIKKHKIKTLFVEPQYSAKIAKTISNETGAKIYFLDPAVTGAYKEDAYVKIMNNNLKTLVVALK